MLSEDVTACAELVRRGDSERFMAVMAAPVAARAVLFPIYAFNVEVARAPWVTAEPMIAEMRLQWWRDALEEIRLGGSVRRHEVVTPLSGVLDGVSAEVLDQLVVARRWDIYKEPFEDAAHFERYLDDTAAGLLWVAARALGQADESVVRDAGWAQGLANWLRAIPALEATGRVPMVDGRADAVVTLARDGLERLARSRAERRGVMPKARPAMLATWQARAVLRRASDLPARVSQGALDPAPVRSRLMLMARAFSGGW